MSFTTALNQNNKRRYKRFPAQEILLVILIFPSLSMTWTDPYRSLLTDEDFLLEDSQDRPAASSPIRENPVWESFNEWQCHPKNRVELYCAIHTFPNYGGKNHEKKTPSMRITTESKEILDFDYDDFGSFNTDCDLTLQEWRRMLDRENVLCIYGAYLQDIADGQTYWILERVKTSETYWPNSKQLNQIDVDENISKNEED